MSNEPQNIIPEKLQVWCSKCKEWVHIAWVGNRDDKIGKCRECGVYLVIAKVKT